MVCPNCNLILAYIPHGNLFLAFPPYSDLLSKFVAITISDFNNLNISDNISNVDCFVKSIYYRYYFMCLIFCIILVDGDFTLWTSWSSCPNACGRTALRSRERYCTNPAPANGGKNCEGPRFQLKLCKIKACRGKPHSRNFCWNSIFYKTEGK